MANKVGRPKRFKKVEELEEAINTYFQNCIDTNRPFTMTGLAMACKVDRKTLTNYGKDDEFFPTVKRARQLVEMSLEERLVVRETFTPGLIFNLKNNAGWVDKSETDLNHKLDRPILDNIPIRKVESRVEDIRDDAKEQVNSLPPEKAIPEEPKTNKEVQAPMNQPEALEKLSKGESVDLSEVPLDALKGML